MYNICTMLDQRRRRWVDVVQNVMQMFCVYWVMTYCINFIVSTFGPSDDTLAGGGGDGHPPPPP